MGGLFCLSITREYGRTAVMTKIKSAGIQNNAKSDTNKLI